MAFLRCAPSMGALLRVRDPPYAFARVAQPNLFDQGADQFKRFSADNHAALTTKST